MKIKERLTEWKKRLKMNKKGSSGILVIVGIALIIIGLIVALVSFGATREEAEEPNPDVFEMFSTYGIGLILGIIFVVMGVLVLILAGKG